jgi:hypothetical protein
VSRIFLSETPSPKAFDVAAPRKEWAENLDISISDRNKTSFIHLALLKTSKPEVPSPNVVLHKFQKKELCVVHTLDEYLSREEVFDKETLCHLIYLFLF